MTRQLTLVLAVTTVACGDLQCSRTPAAPPSAAQPEVGRYDDLVSRTQAGAPQTETRTELACAKAFADANAAAEKTEAAAPPPEPADAGPAEDFDALLQRMKARDAHLDTLPFAQLLKEANDDELNGAVLRRLFAREAAGLKPAERDLVLLADLDGEVNNGGLHQYFFNSSGDGAVAAREALERLGAADRSKILDCALTAFPDSKPSADREQRNEQLARWGKRQFEVFEDLDDAWYRQPSMEPSLSAQIRKHADAYPSAAAPLGH